MAKVTLGGNPVNTVGELPAVGKALPAFTLTGGDLSDVTSASLAGKNVILNIFPSIDTPTCQSSVREFNKRAAALDNLPFAMGRFCGAEGISNVSTASTFRSYSFGQNYGVALADGKLAGLMARAVVVADASGKIVHTELVSEIAHEPNYDAALKSLK
jgi:thioredoxin-dependent peroxiredoxin